jgi:solute carrier family 35 protein F5
LKQDIFADNTYSKPYFVTYINTSFFAVALIPIFARRIHQDGISTDSLRRFLRSYDRSQVEGTKYTEVSSSEEESGATKGDDDTGAAEHDQNSSSGPLLSQQVSHRSSLGNTRDVEPAAGVLNLLETAKLSFEFCVLWFVVSLLQPAGYWQLLINEQGKLFRRWMSEIYHCCECHYTYFYKQ